MPNIKSLLEKFRRGELDINELLDKIHQVLYKDLFYAKIDTLRSIRRGFPEVVFAEGKTPQQIREIVNELLKHEDNILITHADKDVYRELKDIQGVKYYEKAKLITIGEGIRDKKGLVAVLTGGTGDIPIAEEAAITAEFFGANVIRIFDVGVAGIQRLLDNLGEIRKADVIIVCAGMDGALFSVVAGLVNSPVIAVPTSVGYGANFGGIAPLLTALNSCVPGVASVNIDNGFGAGYFATLLIKKIYGSAKNSSQSD